MSHRPSRDPHVATSDHIYSDRDAERLRRFEAKRAAKNFSSCPRILDVWALVEEILQEDGWQKPEPIVRTPEKMTKFRAPAPRMVKFNPPPRDENSLEIRSD